MAKMIVAFRGTRTEQILEDAKKFGIFQDGDTVTIICRRDDKLAKEGDVVDFQLSRSGETVVIANGGTTAQLVPIICGLAASAAEEDSLEGMCEYRSDWPYPARDWGFQVVEVQTDGVGLLYDRNRSL